MSETTPNILGCNERWYLPEFAKLMDAATTMVCVRTVLVAGDIGDYAAYQGIGSQEYVARHGDKIRFAEACCHFPGGQLEESRYRQ
jgi:hypothetical protein